MERSACVLAYIRNNMEQEQQGNMELVHNALQEHCNGTFDYVCIFGVGLRGKKLFYELSDRLMTVECFADNDSDKWGNVIENTYCIPPDYLKLNQDNILVIISVEHGIEDIYKQLQQLGIKNLLSGAEVLAVLNKVPKVLPLGCVEDMDYNMPQVHQLISKFNSLIHETCSYYERKMEDLSIQLRGEGSENSTDTR